MNGAPSLTANTSDDYKLKTSMLDELITIVDLENELQGDELRVGGWDVVHRGGTVIAAR